MPSAPPLTLDVADCGPVARACVELRPLTVFVGPSNTGKTWLATLAYALHRYLGAVPEWLPRYRLGIAPAALPESAHADLLRTAGRELATAVFMNAESGKEDGIEPTAPLKAAVRLHAEEEGGAIGKEIERCFGLDAGRLIRAGSAGARIRLRHAIDGVSTPAAHELKVRDSGWTFLPTVPDGLRIRSGRLAWLARLLPTEDESGIAKAHRAWDAVGALARYVLPKRRLAFYLPADRTGLMNAHATVVSALIQSATMAGIRRADPVPPLSGVRGDFPGATGGDGVQPAGENPAPQTRYGTPRQTRETHRRRCSSRPSTAAARRCGRSSWTPTPGSIRPGSTASHRPCTTTGRRSPDSTEPRGERLRV